MATREQQREATRRRIIDAAERAFSNKGFLGAGTREIARSAGVNQGLIAYHFRSKETLWKAVAARIFERLAVELTEPIAGVDPADRREMARERIRRYVRFVATRPELFRLMVEEGKHSDRRMKWLVDNYMKQFYEQFTRLATIVGRIDEIDLPHMFYVLAGGASMIFAIRPECKRLTGVDPLAEDSVERHAEFMARLLVP